MAQKQQGSNPQGLFRHLLVSIGSIQCQKSNFLYIFEEAKLAHLNWHRRESNLRPQGGAHS